jgi:hypothetical protein
MAFKFQWHNEEKTVMRYVVEGDWNWRDYHVVVRQSLFSMHRHDQTVDSLIDLRSSTRLALPSGAANHVRSFGKKQSPALSGRALVLGLSAEVAAELGAVDGRLATVDGEVIFVDDDTAAQAVIQRWQNAAN